MFKARLLTQCRKISGLLLVAGLYGLLSPIPVLAATSSNTDDNKSTLEIKQQSKYSKKGADTCLKCHDEDSEYPVLDIFKTAHGSRSDKHSPLAQYQCETCHGPVGKHGVKRLRKGRQREHMITFKPANGIPVSEKNKICSSCHQQVEKSHWGGSTHQVNDIACADCHQIHAVKDPIQIKSAQLEVCGKCHQSQRLAANRFSTHPVKYGEQMGCVDCHSPHGSVSEHLLVAETINDTCFQCHAEKRGPFAWEHEPASENCALCHSPHGSNNKAMLNQKAPFLCQNCHSSQGHPSVAQNSSGLTPPAAFASSFLLGRGCVNCHSKVHGSNHPSGNLFQR